MSSPSPTPEIPSPDALRAQMRAEIRAQMRAIVPAAAHGGIGFGDARVDACLPGGLPLGALHEVAAAGIEAEMGALAAGFVACWLGRIADPRPVFWIAPDRSHVGAGLADLNPAGLLAYGLDPARLVLVRTEGDGGARGTLAAMEAALRGGAVAAAVAEVGRVGRLAARRLHLACLAQGGTGFLLRRWPHGRAVRREPLADEGDAGSVATRWHLSAAPSLPQGGREPGAPRWTVALRHARGGRPGSWLMEVSDAHPGTAMPLRVVAGLGDAAPAPQRKLRAG